MRLLKTNTAVRISIGPFVDYETGDPEIALTVTNTICEMMITPNDGSAVTRTAITLTASGGNNDMVHITDDVGGYYDLELTQSQTNFLGRMRLAFTDADIHMSLWEDFLVVSANVFNAMVTGTETLDVDATTITSNADITAILGDTNELQGLIISSKLPAQIKGTDDIDFSATQKTSLNAATPASVQGAVASVTNAVTITSNADITSILADTNELQGLITSSKLPAQVEGMDANVITASALATDAVTEIITAIKAMVIDGAITFQKAVQIRLAKDAGTVVVDGNTFKYYDQSGVLLLTDPITITGSTRVVA